MYATCFGVYLARLQACQHRTYMPAICAHLTKFMWLLSRVVITAGKSRFTQGLCS
jgi:hypothetical protein